MDAASKETPLARGNALLAAGDVDGALKTFKEALDANPSSADAHEALARAHIKQGAYLEAAEAAVRATELAPLQAKGYLRRGIALYHLEEYETALAALQRGKELRPTLAAFDTWARKCRKGISGEASSSDDDGGAAAARPPGAGPKITILPAPGARADAPAPAGPSASSAAKASSSCPAKKPPQQQQQENKQQQEAKKKQEEPPMFGSTAALAPAPNKVRHQWYQMADRVVVDVYAKALPPERFAAEFGESRLRLRVLRDPAAAGGGGGEGGKDGGGEGGDDGVEWELDTALSGRVVPAECRYAVLRTKVEVTLRKAEPERGAWRSLEAPAAPPPPTPSAAGIAPPPVAPQTQQQQQQEEQQSSTAAAAAAARPSAAPRGPKDWSAVEREVKELEAAGELDEGDALNGFFKKIFSQGDEDTRRAMMKSFVESNGTVLSTNWAEVGAKKVECTPPGGMEVRKYEQ